MPQAKIEKTMDEYFVKKAPFQIPKNGREALVEWMPWISLVFGIISLLAALGFWRAGHVVNEAAVYVNTLSQTYGTGETVSQLGFMFYVSLIALVVQGALMVIAFPGLRDRSKSKGWNILLFSALLSFVYGVFRAFTDYGDVLNIFTAALGLVIGLYILAQIKTYYKK